MKEDDKYHVTLGCSGAFEYRRAVSIKEVEVTSINITSTADTPDDNDNDVDIKKAMYSITCRLG